MPTWARGIDDLEERKTCAEGRRAAARNLEHEADNASSDGWPEEPETIGWAIVVDVVTETARGKPKCGRCGAEVGVACDPGGGCTPEDRESEWEEIVEYDLLQSPELPSMLAELLISRPQLLKDVRTRIGELLQLGEMIGAPL